MMVKILQHHKGLLCNPVYAMLVPKFFVDKGWSVAPYFAGLVLMFGTEVLWPFPAACGQVKDGSGSHVCSLGIVGIIISTGGGGRAALRVASW